jgi:UDP-N-acetyl-D-mannosaminuronic acid dehydrogenase
MIGIFMKISVLGLGYVGLPTAALFASKGIQVTGFDINQQLIDIINSGDVHISEPGLKEMVKSVVSTGYLKAVNSLQAADVFIIAVPTPINDDKSPNLMAFEQAIGLIAPILQKGNLIIIESTVPLKTVEATAYTFSKMRPDLAFPVKQALQADIAIAYCPERVLPGQTLHELRTNARTIGGLNEISASRAAEVYRLICEGELLLTDALTAEMVKLIENAYRDVNIAFANELSMLCDECEINVHQIIDLANRHPRVNILNPGPGVGGHCIPIDPWFIVDAFPERARIIRTAREVNDTKTAYVLQQIIDEAKNYKSPKIAILGISYKANIDDFRESPALRIIQQLLHLDNIMYIADPYFKELPQGLNEMACLNFVSIEEAILAANIVVILVGHDQIRALSNESLQGKRVIDTLGIVNALR